MIFNQLDEFVQLGGTVGLIPLKAKLEKLEAKDPYEGMLIIFEEFDDSGFILKVLLQKRWESARRV